MELFESNYWKLTTFLQKIIGLWFFYQNRWKNYLAWFYVYAFTFSFMISMGVRLYNEIGHNLDIVVENIIGEMYLILVFSKLTISIVFLNKGVRLYNEIGVHIDIVVENIVGEMYLTAVFAKLSISIVFMKKLKYLYEQIAKDWKIIVDVDELKVMHKYTEIGRKSVTLYSAFMIIGVATFLALPITAPLLDYVIPLENATRPKALPYYAEYGIDQEKYYYPLITQAIFGGVGTITVLVTFDLGFILTVQHVVALFELVNFRLGKVSSMAEAIENHLVDFFKGDHYAYQNTVFAINLHQIVIEYVDLIEKCYSLAWLIILFLNMVMVGGGLAIMLLKMDRPEELLRYGVVLAAGLIHFYYIFLPGQKIINSSSEVFDKCYGCKWYNLSEKSKNLIKIMMIRSLRRSELTGGKMFVLCMDTYCNMMKTGLSVFTVLRA